MNHIQNHLVQLVSWELQCHSAFDVIDITSRSYYSEVFIGGLVAVSSASQLDETVPVFLSTDKVISVVLSASTPVLGDHDDHAIHSSGNAYCDPLSEIQLDDTVPVFTPIEEISVAPFTSTPVSEEHVEHTDHSSFEAGYELLTVGIKLQSKSVRGNDLSVQR